MDEDVARVARMEERQRCEYVARGFLHRNEWRCDKADGSPKQRFSREEVLSLMKWTGECIAREIAKGEARSHD